MNRSPAEGKYWSVRTLLAWLVLACLLPGVIGATVLLVYQYREARSQQEKDTIQMTRALVQAVDHHLLRTQAVAQSLSTADSLRKGDFAHFHRRAREAIALSGLGTNVVLRDSAGRQILNTTVEFGESLPQQPLRDSIKKVFSTGAPVISDLFFGLPLNRPLMSVDVPVIIDGKVAYALGVGILPEHFNDILAAQNFPSHWVAAVFDSSGTIVGRTHSAEKLIGTKATSALTQQMNGALTGSGQLVTQEGVSVLAYHSRSAATNWRVAIGISRSAAQDALVRQLWLLAAGVAALFALGLALAWFTGGRIARSVKGLAAPAMSLASGEAAPPTAVHTKETLAVEAAIGRAASLLDERAVKLQAKNEELTEAHLLAKFGTWSWDLKTGQVATSESIPKIYGRAVPSFPEQRGTLLTVESWEKLDMAARDVVRTGKGFDLELQVNHGQGGVIWINTKSEPVRNEADEVIALRGTIQDITERIHAEKSLRESEAKFRGITDAVPQMVWSTRPDGYHDFYNQQWYRFTGVPEGSTDGAEWNGVFHPDDQEAAWKAWTHSLETGETYEIEYRLRHHSGQYRWTLGRALPVRDEHGRIVRWMGTCTDIHEQKLARQALEAADQRKDEFLAMLAHELRNPLAPIAAAADLLQLAPASEERVRTTSEIISRQASHMTALIDDLLDVSRVTRGLVVLEKTVLDVKRIVADAVEQVRPLITARAHRLSVLAGSGPTMVSGDQKRLVQVLTNLLNNSAKYTPEGGNIVVEIASDASQVMISVADDGVGMSQDLLERAFGLFTQGARSADRSQGGLGIGLALVKSIVELHHGSVTAHSEGSGKGSKFIVRLPRIDAESESPANPEAGEGTEHSDSPLKILVVDDNADAASTLSMFLQTFGHTVLVEYGPYHALERAHKERPDICILDIGLPDMDGNEMARRLRSQPETAQSVLVALTGYGQEKDRETSLHAGFDHHFVKPVNLRELVGLLDKVKRPS